MKRTPRLRIVVYALTAIAIVAAIWAVALAHEREERTRRLDADAETARRIAVFFERHALSILRYADAYVRMVRREYGQHHDLERVRDLLAKSPLDQSIVSHVTIIDAQGTPLLVSGHDVRPGSSAADRGYFLRQRDADGDPALVSLPHVGRNSGKLIFRLVRRITDAGGDFAGVVFAAIEASAVTEFFQSLNLGAKSSATLVGTDKRIRARSSYGSAGPGQDISGSRIWRELAMGPVGLYTQTSVVDQITRQYAYRKLEDYPLIVAIGIATEGETLAPGQVHDAPYVIAGLASVLVLTMALLLGREALTSARVAASEERVRTINAQLEMRVMERTAALEEVQQELLRKERLAVLGQLTGTVAHELRNPLSTITAAAALLGRRVDGSDRMVDEALARLQRNVERCNGIITELLDFARTRGVETQPTELDGWLAEVIENIPLPAAVSAPVAAGAPGLAVPMDRERLRRAVINVVENARDALTQDGASGGTIRIGTRLHDDRAEILVDDDGPGMAPEVLERVREPLFSTKSFGVGLGLPIVQRIMEEHGGGLEIDSRAGRGTRVVLWLPAS